MRSGHAGRGWWIALAAIVLLVIVARLAMPAIVKSVVNHKLETMPGGYQGSVEDVAVRILDGEIGLRNFRIVKKNGLVPVRFMAVKELVLGTVRDSWRLRTVLRFVEPNASFVQNDAEAKKQWGPPHTLDHLQEQLPFQLLRVEIEDGQAHFRDFQTKPDIDAYATKLNIVWDKLVGCLPPGSSACRSNLEGRANVMKTGKLKLKGTFERSPKVDFKLNAALDNLRAAELNPPLTKFAKIDVKKGTVDLDARYDRKGDSHDILLVPYLSDFEVAGSDDKKGTSFFRELGVAAAAGFFERRKGEKAVSIKSRPGGDTDFKLVDSPQKKAAEKAKD
ncbi:MAG: hypothetical protein JWN04_2492 [Myxococcaceae bacterium]|nr:hypothetical protein [Myxococcaceae bacterium]